MKGPRWGELLWRGVLSCTLGLRTILEPLGKTAMTINERIAASIAARSSMHAAFHSSVVAGLKAAVGIIEESHGEPLSETEEVGLFELVAGAVGEIVSALDDLECRLATRCLSPSDLSTL